MKKNTKAESIRAWKSVRGKLSLSQEKFGILIGYQKETVSRKERGKLPITKTDLLALKQLALGG